MVGLKHLGALGMALLSIPAQAACNVALSPADIERAVAISIGAEYGDATAQVNKWTGEIRVGLAGSPSRQDREALEQVIAELGVLIAPTRITLVESGAEMVVQFAPVEDFPRLNSNYVPVNYGFFWMYADDAGLYDADVLISTTGLTRQETDHIIREEVTQSLGMANDLDDAADSIFYAPWTDTQVYSASDTRVIRALYCADVVHGMSPAEFERVLSRSAAALAPAQIKAMQVALVARGYDIGQPDGVMGAQTRHAVSAEQEALGLYVDGVPSLGFLARLKVKS